MTLLRWRTILVTSVPSPPQTHLLIRSFVSALNYLCFTPQMNTLRECYFGQYNWHIYDLPGGFEFCNASLTKVIQKSLKETKLFCIKGVYIASERQQADNTSALYLLQGDNFVTTGLFWKMGTSKYCGADSNSLQKKNRPTNDRGRINISPEKGSSDWRYESKTASKE